MGLLDMGIGDVANTITTVVNKIWPDKTEQEKAQLQLMGQQIANELAQMQAQADINKEEAKSASVFVAGARPFIMWVLGFAMAWNYVLLPIAMFICSLFGMHPIIPVLDMSVMMPVLMGILGLGAYRSYDKMKGTSK